MPAAHRGYRSAGPDNSLQAITSAITEKIPFIEIDVRKSATSELILFHDRRIQKGTIRCPLSLEGREFSSLSPEEIESLRLLNGERLVRLVDALTVIRNTQTYLLLDLKPDSTEMLSAVLAVLENNPAVAPSVVVQCQSERCVDYLAAQRPRVKFLARVHREEELLSFAQANPFIIQVDPALVLKARKLVDQDGPTHVLVKTLGEPPDEADSWKKMCQVGADVVLTDRPVLFKTLMSSTFSIDLK